MLDLLQVGQYPFIESFKVYKMFFEYDSYNLSINPLILVHNDISEFGHLIHDIEEILFDYPIFKKDLECVRITCRCSHPPIRDKVIGYIDTRLDHHLEGSAQQYAGSSSLSCNPVL